MLSFRYESSFLLKISFVTICREVKRRAFRTENFYKLMSNIELRKLMEVWNKSKAKLYLWLWQVSIEPNSTQSNTHNIPYIWNYYDCSEIRTLYANLR